MQLETILANITNYCELNDPMAASHLPIYNTATFDLKKQIGNNKIYDYSRSDNPTRNALETIFTLAENGSGCCCTNTGLSAISLLLNSTLQQNDTILVESDCYGGTFRLLNVLKERNNIQTIFADFTNINSLKNIIENNCIKLILCESPTNPGLKIIDLAAISELAREHNILFAVDNSLATFVSQRPLDYGADFSVFSTTKFISGHGSVTAGAIVSKSQEWARKIQYLCNAEGKAQSPFDVYLVSLGLPTLPYRMRIQEESALKIAKYLEKHSKVKSVKFPALENHPQFELARKQMKVVPSVLTIELGSTELAESLVKKSKILGEKVSFGTADSRIEIPARMSHASLSVADLERIGLSHATVRLSIGLENTADIINDIENALK